jgi:hypothetical protein
VGSQPQLISGVKLVDHQLTTLGGYHVTNAVLGTWQETIQA